jgi:hypothetical protein
MMYSGDEFYDDDVTSGIDPDVSETQRPASTSANDPRVAALA